MSQSTLSNSISTLSELIEALANTPIDEFKEIAHKLDLDLSDLAPYLFWSEKNYTRNCIVRTDEYELLALCWSEGQGTPIHCHNKEECWVVVVEGRLKERLYKNEDEVISNSPALIRILQAGDATYMNDDIGYHSLENIYESETVSLHLYVKPIKKCTNYDPINEHFDLITMKDYSIEGVKV